MPMTTRQLAQSTEDYKEFLPVAGEVFAVEECVGNSRSTCDICGRKLRNWEYGTAKQLVIVPSYAATVRHYRLLVCRQGVACRKRRRAQVAESAEGKRHAVKGPDGAWRTGVIRDGVLASA